MLQVLFSANNEVRCYCSRNGYEPLVVLVSIFVTRPLFSFVCQFVCLFINFFPKLSLFLTGLWTLQEPSGWSCFWVGFFVALWNFDQVKWFLNYFVIHLFPISYLYSTGQCWQPAKPVWHRYLQGWDLWPHLSFITAVSPILCVPQHLSFLLKQVWKHQ